MNKANLQSKVMIQPGRVAVLMGGDSAEREISLLSGEAVLRALKNKGVDAVGIDVDQTLPARLVEENISRVFNVLHGRGGEDGKLQGMLALMEIPCTGSDLLASALSMDKVKTKQIWNECKLKTPAFFVLNDQCDWKGIIDVLGEAVVKPAREGSSIGMSMVSTADALRDAFEKASEFDSLVMAEKRISGGEFSVPVLHGQALPAIELKPAHDFYDYDAKYVTHDTQYICPVALPEEKVAELESLSLHAFDALGASGWGRVDVMQDAAGEFWLLELNTVPGMTDQSLVPMSAAQCGMDFEELVLTILYGVEAG